MADNLRVKPGGASDPLLRTTDAAGVHTPHHHVASLPSLPAGTNVIGQVYGAGKTVTTSFTRPANTTAYAVDDAISDSTSAPASGGFTFTAAGRVSGGSGLITDALIISSNGPGTLLTGSLFIFDSAVTNINDNAAFALSDSDAKLLVGVIPFTLALPGAGIGCSYAHVQNLSIGYTCVGSANLRFLVKAGNAYTPASGEEFTFRIKVAPLD
jgi:hypothetical protein